MKLKKALKITIVTTSIAVIAIILSIVVYMETGGDKFFTSENKKIILEEVKSSPPLPENFLNAYNSVYPNSLDGNYWGYFIEKFADSKSRRKCPCSKVANLIDQNLINEPKNGTAFETAQMTFELEDHLTQTECLQFNLSKFDFTNGVIGVENISLKLFSKPLSELDNSELAEILVIMKNPLFYSKNKNSEKFEIERKKINEKLGTTLNKTNA